MLYELEGRAPELHGSDQFIAHNATVVGHVELHEKCSVWFNAVLRGDLELITIGPETNVQDGAVLHTDPGKPLTLGRGVTVGHKAMLHGCAVGDYSLIGINAVVLNGAKIGKHCLIGAGALISEGMEIPDGSLVIGAPGKIKRQLTERQQQMLEQHAASYVQNAARFITGLKPVEG
ncbi:gamma carbonic anhydrase family protein [Marinobacter sp. X15-166B]|uniref:gamma carbonic anhydrase family protein n=1 Tax=Marinobacter sp. X15-166B TaxID=1897620 RepID=UPI00085BB744|nr:gamma carbonic anhydrase family protein [Marinobacter sp. X15-166B]OEY65013.1 gamma carbonic anhydrase family protein [Marinobacter sp. X15-166B]